MFIHVKIILNRESSNSMNLNGPWLPWRQKTQLPGIFNTVICCPAAVLDPHVALGWICFEDVPPMFS